MHGRRAGGDFAVGPVSLPGLGSCFLFTIRGGYMLRTQRLLCGHPDIIRHPWVPWGPRDATGSPEDSGHHRSRDTSQRGFLWLVPWGSPGWGGWHSSSSGMSFSPLWSDSRLQRRGAVTEAEAGQQSSERCPSPRATSPINQEPQTVPVLTGRTTPLHWSWRNLSWGCYFY